MTPDPKWYTHAVSALLDRQPGSWTIVDHWAKSYSQWRIENADVPAAMELLQCSRGDIVKMLEEEWRAAVLDALGDALESLSAMRH